MTTYQITNETPLNPSELFLISQTDTFTIGGAQLVAGQANKQIAVWACQFGVDATGYVGLGNNGNPLWVARIPTNQSINFNFGNTPLLCAENTDLEVIGIGGAPSGIVNVIYSFIPTII